MRMPKDLRKCKADLPQPPPDHELTGLAPHSGSTQAESPWGVAPQEKLEVRASRASQGLGWRRSKAVQGCSRALLEPLLL